MPDLSDEAINAYLGPATAGLAAEDIKNYRTVLNHMTSKVTASTASLLVALAHRVTDAGATAWLTPLISAKMPDFVTVNNSELVARLAATAAVQILTRETEPAVAVGLFVHNAVFLDLDSAVPELHEAADLFLRAAAHDVRARPEDWQPIEAEINKAAKSIANDEPDMSVVAGTLTRIAQAVDQMGTRADQRFRLIDEEYNALWWSYTRRSTTTGETWDKTKPLAKRVVLAANELTNLLEEVPGPPLVPALLGLALGNERDKLVTVGDVATTAWKADAAVVEDADDRLLPISSAVRQLRILNSDDDTWKSVLRKTLDIDVGAKVSAISAAMELYRESELAVLL